MFRNCTSFICYIVGQSTREALSQTWETPVSFSRQLLLCLFFLDHWSGSCDKLYHSFRGADTSNLSTALSFFECTATDNILVFIKFILHHLFFHLFVNTLLSGNINLNVPPTEIFPANQTPFVLSQWNPFLKRIQNSFQDSVGHSFCTVATHNAPTF